MHSRCGSRLGLRDGSHARTFGMGGEMKTVITARSRNVVVTRTLYGDLSQARYEAEMEDIQHRAKQLDVDGMKVKSPRLPGEE